MLTGITSFLKETTRTKEGEPLPDDLYTALMNVYRLQRNYPTFILLPIKNFSATNQSFFDTDNDDAPISDQSVQWCLHLSGIDIMKDWMTELEKADRQAAQFRKVLNTYKASNVSRLNTWAAYECHIRDGLLVGKVHRCTPVDALKILAVTEQQRQSIRNWQRQLIKCGDRIDGHQDGQRMSIPAVVGNAIDLAASLV